MAQMTMRLALAVASALAAAPVLGTEVDLAPPEIRIPPGGSREATFGPIPQASTTVVLVVAARLDAPSLSGSMYHLGLAINDVPVTAAWSRSAGRLQGKPLVSPVAADLPAPWYGTGGWRVLFAHDFEAARAQPFYPYTLVLDVTDLVHASGANRLRITNTASPDLARRRNASLDLVIGVLRVETRPGVSRTVRLQSVPSHEINHGDSHPASASYEAELAEGGGLTLRVGGRSLPIETDISYPDAGLNRLVAGPPDTSGQPDWSGAIRRSVDRTEVAARGSDYLLRRQVRVTPRKVEVADTFTNTHAERGLGLLVRHRLMLEGQSSPEVRLAGSADPGVNEYSSAFNPSVHVGLSGIGVGLLCEDDVFRNQARLFYDPDLNAAGFRTEMLWLPPGGSYTLRWSVWPVASAEYYDFVNLVREDWGSNDTVEGGWTFFDPDQILAMPMETLRGLIGRLGVRFACSGGGWVDRQRDARRIGFGPEVASDYWVSYRGRLRKATQRLHEANPGIKVLIYYNALRDTHADASYRYPDSLLTGPGGHEQTDFGGQYSRTWSIVATADNSFGRAMLGLVDLYLNEIGADGLYWDEMEAATYGAPSITWSVRDGHSCILDPKTYTVRAEVGLTALLGEAFRLAVIEKVRHKGGAILGNGPPTTRALLAARVQRMVEIQHNDTYHYDGDLATPLGYGGGRADFANVTRALGQARLLVATSLDQKSEISRYLFPFTPLELHPGYLLGRERIVTMHSGRYGWPGETVRCQVRVFDREGTLRGEREATAGPDGLPIELGEGEVAVLERLRPAP
jgi:hypothetical protein